MKASLPEPDSSIRLYYAFTYSPNAASGFTSRQYHRTHVERGPG